MADDEGGWRSYEVYQRVRPAETLPQFKPRRLTSRELLDDPYPILAVLREHSPCYRDWPGNAFWVTRYDDVTSVFVDDANYETRSKRWRYGLPEWGHDLGANVDVLACVAARLDAAAEPVARQVVGSFAADRRVDLAVELAARYPLELLVEVLDLPADAAAEFAACYLTMQRGVGWDPVGREAGLAAMEQLASSFEPLVAKRSADGGDDLVSVVARLGGTARDLVATLLEGDHETLHGGLANLWFLLLTHPDQLDAVRADRRLVKFAYLETLRHSPPVLSADRFCRHEVERFGRLLPEGALVRCSAAAANRDPRVFAEPDAFVVGRKDLCQREPRGSYRADGLPSGVSFGTGPPSRYPAEPEDRPRSRYAITRALAVTASQVVLDELPAIRLADSAEPRLRALRLGEMHTCWSSPVVW
ncbi:MAG: cytochrome P450 [Ilumatobacteraceae bacterium]